MGAAGQGCDAWAITALDSDLDHIHEVVKGIDVAVEPITEQLPHVQDRGADDRGPDRDQLAALERDGLLFVEEDFIDESAVAALGQPDETGRPLAHRFCGLPVAPRAQARRIRPEHE
jgi:hypothetical protein